MTNKNKLHDSAWKESAVVMALFISTKRIPVVTLAIIIQGKRPKRWQESRQVLKLEEKTSGVTLENSNECSEGFQKYCEDQVSMFRRLLGIRHLSTSKYGQKASINSAPAHKSVLEQVTS